MSTISFLMRISQKKKNTLTGKVVLYVSFLNILRLLEGASFLDAA